MFYRLGNVNEYEFRIDVTDNSQIVFKFTSAQHICCYNYSIIIYQTEVTDPDNEDSMFMIYILAAAVFMFCVIVAVVAFFVGRQYVVFFIHLFTLFLTYIGYS
jgi:hypothetical protein